MIPPHCQKMGLSSSLTMFLSACLSSMLKGSTNMSITRLKSLKCDSSDFYTIKKMKGEVVWV